MSSAKTITQVNSFTTVFVALGKSVSEVRGVKTLFKFANVTVDLMGKLDSEFPAPLKEISRNFKECSSTLSFMGTVGLVKTWVNDKRTRWQSTVTLINITALQLISASMYLEKVKLIDLSYFSMTIGNTPILSLAMSGFGFGVSVFGLWDSLCERQEVKTEYSICEGHQKQWKERQDQFKQLKDHEIDAKIQEYFGEGLQAPLKDYTDKDKKEYLEKRLDFEVIKSETLLNENQATQKKLQSSLIMSIIGLALTILGYIGQYAGVAILASTSLPMLMISFILSGIGVIQLLKSHMRTASSEISPLENARMHLIAAAKADPILIA